MYREIILAWSLHNKDKSRSSFHIPNPKKKEHAMKLLTDTALILATAVAGHCIAFIALWG